MKAEKKKSQSQKETSSKYSLCLSDQTPKNSHMKEENHKTLNSNWFSSQLFDIAQCVYVGFGLTCKNSYFKISPDNESLVFFNLKNLLTIIN